MSADKVLLLFPSTNRHLGLWDDLETDERCYLRCAKWKEVNNRFSAYFQYYYFLLYKRFNWLPFHYYLMEYHDIYKLVKGINHLIIIDGALNTVELTELRKCKKINPSLKCYLYLINSIGASSPIMRKVRPKITQFDWNAIFTFDPVEAKKYNYSYLGFNYFSSHSISLEKSELPTSDVFFVGGLKGGRTKLIYEIYTRLTSFGVKCDFYLMPIENKDVKQLPGIYYFNGWRPYNEIQQHTQNSKCILEIIQEGQYGATLRYFEAVSMNKKLLTNNPHIVDFPFYDSRWMRIFKTPDDIDLDWLNKEEPVDYNYANEFSPKHLIDFILSEKLEQ
jgi:hypothetical protein